MSISSGPVFLTIGQLAERWQKPKQWIYSNHHRLGMKVLHVGQQIRFPLKEVEAWESQQMR